jgi:hypothetical protein
MAPRKWELVRGGLIILSLKDIIVQTRGFDLGVINRQTTTQPSLLRQALPCLAKILWFEQRKLAIAPRLDSYDRSFESSYSSSFLLDT